MCYFEEKYGSSKDDLSVVHLILFNCVNLIKSFANILHLRDQEMKIRVKFATLGKVKSFVLLIIYYFVH